MVFIKKKDILIPKRKPDSHKGDNGKVLVIGGSKDYVGAVALAGLAALRSGVDWVTLAVPERVGWAINSLTPDLVVKKYKGNNFSSANINQLLSLENDFDAVLIGNGIGKNSKAFVRGYVKKSLKPLVIDADAIKHISLEIIKNAILTPHIIELSILLENSGIDKSIINNLRNTKSIIKKSVIIKNILKKYKNKNIVILLKGRIDAIISRNRIVYNKTGNAGMTKAGTGDVLAGLCLGFLGQGLGLFQSAINAAYFNGLAGDILLKKKKGFTYLASDLVEEIKSILKH